jgi:hypothetical protein
MLVQVAELVRLYPTNRLELMPNRKPAFSVSESIFRQEGAIAQRRTETRHAPSYGSARVERGAERGNREERSQLRICNLLSADLICYHNILLAVRTEPAEQGIRAGVAAFPMRRTCSSGLISYTTLCRGATDPLSGGAFSPELMAVARMIGNGTW